MQLLNKKLIKSKYIYITIGIVSLLPWIIMAIYFHDQVISNDITIWNNLGGYIGGVTTSLTLPITLVFVYKTYKSQKEIEKLSFTDLKIRGFESYFFELLKTFNQYRFEQMKFWRKVGNEEKEWISGGRFFVEKRRFIQQEIKRGKELKQAYNDTIDQNNLNWEYYFRALNSLLVWVYQSSIHENEKIKYELLLTNSLTNDEKFFIKNLDKLRYNWGIDSLLKRKEKLTKDINFSYKND